MKETWVRTEIRVEGHLAAHRLRHFEGLVVRPEADGKMVLVGHFRDQPALFGLLNWLDSLGVHLVSVQRLEETEVPYEEEEEERNHVNDCDG